MSKRKKAQNIEAPTLIAIGILLAIIGFFALMPAKPKPISESIVIVGRDAMLEQDVQEFLDANRPAYDCMNTVVGHTNLRVWASVACSKGESASCNYEEYSYDPETKMVTSRSEVGDDGASNWKTLLPADVYSAYVEDTGKGTKQSSRCDVMLRLVGQ